ncbi:MAG: hypothetical protein U1F81_18220 [Verrucomicrobiaceae bacterium]
MLKLPVRYFMKLSLIGHLILLLIALTLSSCVIPDPVYQQNFREVQDINYPDSQVVGMWMIAGVHKVFQEDRIIKVDDRFYLLLQPGGTGLLQEFHKFDGKETPSLTERKVRWRSVGSNRWQFVTQPHTVKLLSEPEGMTVTLDKNSPPRIVTFRFHENRLYPSDVPNTWVRADEYEVKRKLTEIRSLVR